MNEAWRNLIDSTPDILRGKPRVKGTRVPVSMVLGYLANGKTFDEVIADFPGLTREQIKACLEYAKELSEFESAV